MAKNPYTGDPKAHSVDEFKDGMTGTCLCGNVSVTITDKDLFGQQRRGHLCHCANCRKVAGSYVAANLLIPESDVTISDPQHSIKDYEDYATGSAKVVKRGFCSNCGNPIYSKPESAPEGVIILKLGIFPRLPKPEMECFAEHKQDWEPKIEGVTRFKMARGGEKVEE